MKELSFIWTSILDLEFTPGSSNQVIARLIAMAIEKAIRNKSLPQGSPLPTTRQVTAHLSPAVGRATVDMAWRILKNELRLIVTQSGHGTHVVPAFPDREKAADREIAPAYHPRIAHFNSEFILPTDRTIKGLDKAICKEIKQYPMPTDYKIGNKIAPQLVKALLKVVNGSLCSTYKEDELYYAQSQQQLIHHICRSMMPSRKIFVLADTASLLVRRAVNAAGYKVRTVKTDSSGMMMESLEEILGKRNVGIVYVHSRSAMPSRQALCVESVDKLLALQKRFGFTIIEDDQYASFYENNPHILMSKARHAKANVIYIRPVSRIHKEFADTHIVVAWAKLIGLLSDIFQKVGKIMNASLSYMVAELFHKNILPKYEARIRHKMRITMIRARNMLLDSGLWKREGLFWENGWFFYLELRRGHLSADTIDLLREEHIYMMDISDFDCSDVKHMMVLSTAAYLDGDHLEDDIHRLNAAINKVIKNKKNESIL